MAFRVRKFFCAAAIALASLATTARAQTSPDSATAPPPTVDWEKRYQELLAKQRELDERLRVQEQHVTDERKHPAFGFGHAGFYFGDIEHHGTQVRLRLVLQADGRAFFDDTAKNLTSQFVIRRGRPILDGTIGDVVDFRFMPDFGLGTPQLVDAYINLRPWTWLQLRGGKFKVPTGIERVQHDQYLVFLERALPSLLTPDRDVGAMLHGDVAHAAFSWQLGVTNGTPGNTSVDGDLNTAKDYIFRVFAHPFRPLGRAFVDKLGIGFAATYGKERGTSANTSLPSYKTTGQNVFFSYLVDPKGVTTTLASGDHWRVAPQLYYYFDRFGMMTEYIRTSTGVTNGTVFGTVVNQAWQVAASVLLTHDKAAYDGVDPRHPFNLRQHHIGAVEVGARYSELRAGDGAFPIFADPAKSARAALEWAVVGNWYFTFYLRFGLMFARTTFTGGGGATGDRPPEEVLIGRLQLAF